MGGRHSAHSATPTGTCQTADIGSLHCLCLAFELQLFPRFSLQVPAGTRVRAAAGGTPVPSEHDWRRLLRSLLGRDAQRAQAEDRPTRRRFVLYFDPLK